MSLLALPASLKLEILLYLAYDTQNHSSGYVNLLLASRDFYTVSINCKMVLQKALLYAETYTTDNGPEFTRSYLREAIILWKLWNIPQFSASEEKIRSILFPGKTANEMMSELSVECLSAVRSTFRDVRRFGKGWCARFGGSGLTLAVVEFLTSPCAYIQGGKCSQALKYDLESWAEQFVAESGFLKGEFESDKQVLKGRQGGIMAQALFPCYRDYFVKYARLGPSHMKHLTDYWASHTPFKTVLKFMDDPFNDRDVFSIAEPFMSIDKNALVYECAGMCVDS